MIGLQTTQSTPLEQKDEFTFPCIQTTVPQRTIFFSGPLIPNSWFTPAINTISGRLSHGPKQLPQGTSAIKAARFRRKLKTSTNDLYMCWLCEYLNTVELSEGIQQVCLSCGRHRFPEWATCLADQQKLPMFSGDVVQLSRQQNSSAQEMDSVEERDQTTNDADVGNKESDNGENKNEPNAAKESESNSEGKDNTENANCEGLHFVTNIDYRRQYIETVRFIPPIENLQHVSPESKVQTNDKRGEAATDGVVRRRAVRCRVSRQQLCEYECSLVSDRRSLAFRHVLLCGHCGKLNCSELEDDTTEKSSALSHQERYQQDILRTPQQIDVIKGKIRQSQAELDDIEQDLNFLRRRWKENRSKYGELMETDRKYKQLRNKIKLMKQCVEPIQLWCAFCGWQYGKYKNILSRFRELDP